MATNPDQPKQLTPKQRIFVEQYTKDFNGRRAALAAGYSQASAHKVGWDIRRIPHVQAEIEKIIAEKCMGKDEVLTRLAEQARGDVGEFLTPTANGGAAFDYKKAKDKTHLIRKLKTKSRALADDDGDAIGIVETEVEFELYDAQAALVQIGRHLKLFTDKSEVDAALLVGVMTADELAAARTKATKEEKKLLQDE